MRKHFAILLAALLFAGPAAAQDIYSGEGRSQLGPNTTPQEAKEIAFQNARSNALRQFGAEVRSRQLLQTASSSAGRTEMSEKDIAVLATGDAQLIEDSKTTSRRPTEETVVYTVTADFRVDPPQFEKTLEAYQEASSGSGLRESVSTAVKTQDRMSEFAESANQRNADELLARTRRAYSDVRGNVREVDGEDMGERVARKKQKQRNAIVRQSRTILKHGFPQDVIRTRTAKPKLEGTQTIEVEYPMRMRVAGGWPLVEACQSERRTWENIGDRFPDIDKPVRLLLLDEKGRVLIVINKPRPTGPEPHIAIDYGECGQGSMVDHHGFGADEELTWEFERPIGWMRPVDEFVATFIRTDYEKVLEENGYRRKGYFSWQQAREEDRVPAKKIIYTRSRFEREMRTIMQ